jgi:hypothetical protein
MEPRTGLHFFHRSTVCLAEASKRQYTLAQRKRGLARNTTGGAAAWPVSQESTWGSGQATVQPRFTPLYQGGA